MTNQTNGVGSVNSPKRRILAGALALTLVAAACGSDEDTSSDTEAPEATEAETDTTEAGGGGTELAGGSVFVTGSSTVEPISIRIGELAGELSGGELKATVEGPGTGDGFAKFCAGEGDITGASRAIKDEEAAICADAGIEYTELEVAIDGLSVITNPVNEAITCLDVPGLYSLLGPESEGTATWADNNDLATEVGAAQNTPFPDADLVIYGPGEESGTYDSFVEFAIADLAEERGTAEEVRADYSSSANDNLIVEGIESADTSLGWVGYAYYQAEGDRLKGIEIDAGDGCVAPTPETIADGSYPFSRSLFIYVNNASAEENPAVASYVDLYLSDDGVAKVAEAGYVNLPDDRLEAARAAWGS
jgi:phosphate transport system substrate-binding protein